MTGVLTLEFHKSLTTLFKWDRALTAIDPYDSRDDVETDPRTGWVTIMEITDGEAHCLLEILSGLGVHVDAAWFSDEDYYRETPTWEVSL